MATSEYLTQLDIDQDKAEFDRMSAIDQKPKKGKRMSKEKPEVTEIVVRQEAPQSYLPATIESVNAVVQRMEMIQELMKRAMRPGVDYGQIPGTNSKPVLLKSGAEKLCVMFRLCPKYETIKTWEGAHLTVESTCTICDLDGHVLGQASAMCSTKESKYAYRRGERVCPQCGKAAIIKGKAEYGGGWLCWAKKEGCNAKFADNDASITKQDVGRVDNPDIADSYNTVVRIAEKRSYMGAVRLVTGSSALFDEEKPEQEHQQDHGQDNRHEEPPPVQRQPVTVERINACKNGVELTNIWNEAQDNSPERKPEKTITDYIVRRSRELKLKWEQGKGYVSAV